MKITGYKVSIVGDAISDNNRVVYFLLIASLPDSYGTLVIALEANEEVPEMNIITEKLKGNRRSTVTIVKKKQWQPDTYSRKGQKCHQCGKSGPIKRNCRTKEECE